MRRAAVRAPMLALLLAASGSGAGTTRSAPSPTAVDLRIHERLLDLGKSRGAEALEVRCEVTLSPPGRYALDAAIQQSPGLPHWLVPGLAMAFDRNELMHSLHDDVGFAEGHFVQTDANGRASFVLDFDGSDLARFRHDGPWALGCDFVLDDSLAGGNEHPIEQRLEVPTRAWRRSLFARRYGGELGPYPSIFFETRTREELVFTQGWALVVADVVTSDSVGSRLFPPHVDLDVRDCLYGKFASGRVSTRWSSTHPVELCGNGAEAKETVWGRQKVDGPSPGSRWIVAIARSLDCEAWDCQDAFRLPWTEALEARLRRSAKDWPRHLRQFREMCEEKRHRDRRDAARAARASSP